MKQETKELIDWIKKQINLCGECLVAQPNEYWKEDYEKAMKFLDSLPEIELHLCRGGYIQDKNGKPCCEGNQIINPSLLDGTKELGKLYWSVSDCRFYCKIDGKCHGLAIGDNGFEKVEE